jgi:hypothetical protein
VNAVNVKGFLKVSEGLEQAKVDVEKAIEIYRSSLVSITVVTGIGLLRRVDDKRQNVLDWIWTGDYSQRHIALREIRVSNTGQWFLDSDEYKRWINSDFHALIGYGLRISPFLRGLT